MESQQNNILNYVISNNEVPTDILDDLCSRFIINVPEEERKDLIRVCFQIELAHWFYKDFYCKEIMKERKPCGFREFSFQIFKHIPYLQPYVNNVERIIDEWKGYKYSVPTFGAILLDENMTHVLLVQSYCSKYSWGFPKGKINKDESPCHCAIREVYEETGFSIENLINPKEYIEIQVNEQMMRLYVVPGVSRNETFTPKTRFEIKAINWFPVTELPASKKKDTPLKSKTGLAVNSFFLVVPFVRRLRQWIFEHDKKFIKKFKRPRFKSCGDLDYYRYKDCSKNTSNTKDSQHIVEAETQTSDKVSGDKSFIGDNKKLISEGESSNKNTINHNENSSFVEVLSSLQAECKPKILSTPTSGQNKTAASVPFKGISLSESFLKSGISAFSNFKFNIAEIELKCHLAKN